MDDFKERTISGLSWSGIAQIINQLIRFGIGIVLARLLAPQVFGLIGMISVFIGFVQIYSDMGLGAALIQKGHADHRHFSSIFWINLALGSVVTLMFVALAPVVADFYEEPSLEPLTIAISINFFIASFHIVQNALLQKQLRFKALALIDILTIIFSGGTAITLAVLGYGIWSLVTQILCSTLISTVLKWYASEWRPAFLFDWIAVKSLLSFSGNLLGFRTLNYWVRNADNLLIGRFIGSYGLGIYSKAYTIMLYPLRNLSSVISKVMFPALSAIQDDKARIRQIYLKMTRAVALISFPLMSGLFVVSDNFVICLLGEQWRAMIPILRIFCLIGLVQSIGTLNGNIYMSQGRTDLQFKVGGTIGILGVVAIAIGLKWGIEGVAISYGLFSVLATYPSIRIAVSLIDLSFKDMVKNLIGIANCALCMAFAVWGVGKVLMESFSYVALLGIQLVVGVILYWLLVHFFHISTYFELKNIFFEKLQLPGSGVSRART